MRPGTTMQTATPTSVKAAFWLSLAAIAVGLLHSLLNLQIRKQSNVPAVVRICAHLEANGVIIIRQVQREVRQVGADVQDRSGRLRKSLLQSIPGEGRDPPGDNVDDRFSPEVGVHPGSHPAADPHDPTRESVDRSDARMDDRD